MDSVQAMVGFIVNSGGEDFLRAKLNEMSIRDEFFGLDSRLAKELRSKEEKPLRIEAVPSRFEDELSGDYYNKRAIFNADGTIDVVSYKGEGEGFFENESEYREYVDGILNPEMDYYYSDED